MVVAVVMVVAAVATFSDRHRLWLLQSTFFDRPRRRRTTQFPSFNKHLNHRGLPRRMLVRVLVVARMMYVVVVLVDLVVLGLVVLVASGSQAFLTRPRPHSAAAAAAAAAEAEAAAVAAAVMMGIARLHVVVVAAAVLLLAAAVVVVVVVVVVAHLAIEGPLQVLAVAVSTGVPKFTSQSRDSQRFVLSIPQCSSIHF